MRVFITLCFMFAPLLGWPASNEITDAAFSKAMQDQRESPILQKRLRGLPYFKSHLIMVIATKANCFNSDSYSIGDYGSLLVEFDKNYKSEDGWLIVVYYDDKYSIDMLVSYKCE